MLIFIAMKLFHIVTHYDGDIRIPQQVVDKLPSYLLLMGTTQFAQQMPAIKKQIEETGRKVELFRGVHDVNAGQILGCDIFQGGKKNNAYFYVGDGLFHPTALLYDNEQPVHYYNPFSGEHIVLTQKDLKRVLDKRKASIARFYAAENVGVLVTTKPGQNNMTGALELKKRLEIEGKGVFVFVDETLNMSQLENFPFIDCWVNTACPRIIEDTNHAMINLWDLRYTVMKGFGVKVV